MVAQFDRHEISPHGTQNMKKEAYLLPIQYLHCHYQKYSSTLGVTLGCYYICCYDDRKCFHGYCYVNLICKLAVTCEMRKLNHLPYFHFYSTSCLKVRTMISSAWFHNDCCACSLNHSPKYSHYYFLDRSFLVHRLYWIHLSLPLILMKVLVSTRMTHVLMAFC